MLPTHHHLPIYLCFSYSAKSSCKTILSPAHGPSHRDRAVKQARPHPPSSPIFYSLRSQPHRADLELKSTAAIPHLSPHSFFIMSSTFLARSDGFNWASPLAANFATYISANCFRVKAQPCSPEPKPTVPSTGSI